MPMIQSKLGYVYDMVNGTVYCGECRECLATLFRDFSYRQNGKNMLQIDVCRMCAVEYPEMNRKELNYTE